MKTPARLYKKTTPEEELEAIVLKYAYILFPAAIIILLLLFVGLCFAICGVSAVDSGATYNHLADVI